MAHPEHDLTESTDPGSTEREWFRDLDARDRVYAARAHAGDAAALAQIRRDYWELGLAWLASRAGEADRAVKLHDVLHDVDQALVSAILREPRVRLHPRWMQILRAEWLRHRVGMHRGGSSRDPWETAA